MNKNFLFAATIAIALILFCSVAIASSEKGGNPRRDCISTIPGK